jgi:RimJ/RimL family protein N-acetyltransferase
MRLLPVGVADVERLIAGDTGDLAIAPGWPHEDTAPGLSFVGTGGRAWLICDDDDRVVGECGTKTAPDDDGAVEIGYGLAPQSRGHGIGTRTLQLLIAEVRALPDVRRIDASVHVGNTASIRMLERAGFAREGGRGNELSFSLLVDAR